MEQEQEIIEIQTYIKRQQCLLLELINQEKLLGRQIDLDKQQLSGDKKTERITQLEQRIRELEEKPIEIIEEKPGVEELNAYKGRIEEEFRELISSWNKLKKQIEEDEKRLEHIGKQKEDIISEVTLEISSANSRLEWIRHERESYDEKLIGKEQAISVNLIHIEERELQLKRELEDCNITKQKYEEAVDGLVIERRLIEEDKVQSDVERRMIQRMMEDEADKIMELNKIKGSLESKKIKQDKIIKDLKIKKLRLEQKGEANNKTKDFLIKEKESIDKQKLHIESQIEQVKSAFDELRNREAKLNG